MVGHTSILETEAGEFHHDHIQGWLDYSEKPCLFFFFYLFIDSCEFHIMYSSPTHLLVISISLHIWHCANLHGIRVGSVHARQMPYLLAVSSPAFLFHEFGGFVFALFLYVCFCGEVVWFDLVVLVCFPRYTFFV